jgi:hypothetical protein
VVFSFKGDIHMTITSLTAQKLSSNIEELRHAISWNASKCEELQSCIATIEIELAECPMPDCFSCDFSRDELVDLSLDIAELTLQNEELSNTLQCRILELELELMPTWFARYALTEENGQIADCLIKASSYQSGFNAFKVTHNVPCILFDFVLIAE